MTTDKLANSPYLVRFPWDWPAFAWDVARLLVDRWQGGAGDIPFVSDDAEAKLTALKTILASAHVEREAAPGREDLAGTEIDGWPWPEAVAACLRGNRQWDVAQVANPETYDLLKSHGVLESLADLQLPESEEGRAEWRRNRLASAAGEYRIVAELVPEYSLCISAAAAEILLLDLQLGEAARDAYGGWAGNGIGGWGSATESPSACAKLASLLLARAGLQPIDPGMADPDMADYDYAAEAEGLSWSWDADRGLMLRRQGARGEEYPVSHAALAGGSEWRGIWLNAARAIMEACLVCLTSVHYLISHRGDRDALARVRDRAGMSLADVLASGILQDPAGASLVHGLSMLESREKVTTLLHPAFAESPPNDLRQLADAIAELREESRRQHLLTMRRLLESKADLVARLLSLHDKIDSAGESLHRVARQVALLQPELHSNARTDLERRFGTTWSRLSGETQDCLVNAQAIWVANLAKIEWDWALITIELARALEDVLRRFLHPPLQDNIRTWWRSQRKRAPTRDQESRMDIGDYASFLKWSGPNPMWTQLLRSKFRPEHGEFLRDLPDLLTMLNECRKPAAHAGAPVTLREARNMYQSVIGAGDNTSLLARLMNLRSVA